jgi:hypothetical protein
MNADMLTAKYVELRDRKAAIKKAAEIEEAKLQVLLDGIENKLKEIMTETGVKSMKTDHGTAYLTYRESATVADWDVLLNHIKEKGAWELLERRVSKAAVKEVMAEDRNGEYTEPPPPGVNFVRIEGVNVRRS